MNFDPGATAWVLASTALVLLTLPGVAFLYGGAVRAKHVVGMVTQNFTAFAVVSVLWVLAGFSLAFGTGVPLVGDLSFVGLENLPHQLPGHSGKAVPPMAYAGFQMVIAVIAVALLTGATADRWRFGPFIAFVALWSLLVYAPIAHWVFAPGGWAAQFGVLDFAGGIVVHANVGAAALAMAIVLGRRDGWPGMSMRPHNVPLALLGLGMVWCGWLGWSGGSALTADRIAAAAVVNTMVAAAAGVLTWIGYQRIRYGRPTSLGVASGAVAGLVAITSGAGFVSPLGALVIGVAAGVICATLVSFKAWIGLDDPLDVAAVHLGGGVVGALCVGLFASLAINPAGADGVFYGGGYLHLGHQVVVVSAVAGYSFVVTGLIGVFLERLVGCRLSPQEEHRGIDLAQHGEVAYRLELDPPRPEPGTASSPGASDGGPSGAWSHPGVSRPAATSYPAPTPGSGTRPISRAMHHSTTTPSAPTDGTRPLP